MQLESRRRVVIQGVQPELECGQFAVKRTVGETVEVEANVFTDGHETITCVLLHRPESDPAFTEIPMESMVNDLWRGRFTVDRAGRHFYTLSAWIDPFKTWYSDLLKRIKAGQDITVDLQIGAAILKDAAARASGADRDVLLSAAESPTVQAIDEKLRQLAERYADRTQATTYKELPITVDRIRARFSTWYEMFPRAEGTFRNVEKVLPEIAGMGFDVLYFPPIHPIGRTHRKGKNNSRESQPGEPGCPWAIGASEGGHKAVHPDLGTLDDFRHLVDAAQHHGIEIALDLAYQCAPDHPYVKEHPEWFRWRPDGTVQYAENPPKKYEDIYPFNFETAEWQSLWKELKSIVEFWMDQGVRIFRVDNPHTKPFHMWQWMITDLKKQNPDLIFLSEAFTRPKIMYRLAKLGFTQSYTYFTWRNTKQEIVEYFTELTRTEVKEFFRPNLWPNTPDILHEYLQLGGRPAFISRLVLAATLGASYGIYGPAYELQENAPREHGSEEYLYSEKYEVKERDLHSPESLRGLITAVNAIRRSNPALQTNAGLRFYNVDNEHIICYGKEDAPGHNVIITVVNLDFRNTQAGFVELPLEEIGIDSRHPYRLADLLTGATYTWHGPRNYVELRPNEMPAHIFRLED